MTDGHAPYHAHIYYSAEERPAAEALRDLFQRRVGDEGNRRVLFVGQIGQRKGIKYLLEAVRRLDLPDLVTLFTCLAQALFDLGQAAGIGIVFAHTSPVPPTKRSRMKEEPLERRADHSFGSETCQ